MTNEMTIQQRPSALPYMLGGATIGTGAGLVANATVPYLKGSTMSHSDIVSEMNDKDKFEARTKDGVDGADTWKEAKKKQEAVATAEAELKKAKEPSLPDSAKEAQELQDAKDKLSKELEKLTNQEKARLESGNTTTAVYKKGKIIPFSEIPATKLPTGNLEKGNKPFKGNQCELLYNTLTSDLKKAEANLEAKVNAGLGTEKTKMVDLIENGSKHAVNDLKGTTPEQIAKYFAEKETTTGHAWLGTKKTVLTPQYNRAMNLAAIHYPDPTALTPEQFMQIGKEYNPSEKLPKGWTTTPVTVKNASGRLETKIIAFDDEAASQLLDAKKAEVKALRTQAADEIFTNMQKYVALDSRKANLLNEIEKGISAEVADKTGLRTVTGGVDKLNMSQIIAEGNGALSGPAGATSAKGYSADIARISEAIRNKATTLPSGLNGKYTGATLQESLEQATSRRSVYRSYVAQEKALNNEIKATLQENPIIREYDTKISDMMSKDKAVLKARARLAKCFPNLFGETSTTTTTTKLTAEEIVAKAKDYAEKNVGQSLKDDVAKYQSLYDEAAKKGGKVDDAAVKTAEEKVATAKSEFEKATKELGEKYLKGGKAKWIAPVVGAVALGLGALALRPGSKEA